MINDEDFARYVEIECAKALKRSQYIKIVASEIYYYVEYVLDRICRDDPSLASETKEHMKEMCESLNRLSEPEDHYHIDPQIDLPESIRELASKTKERMKEMFESFVRLSDPEDHYHIDPQIDLPESIRELAKAPAPAQSV